MKKIKNNNNRNNFDLISKDVKFTINKKNQKDIMYLYIISFSNLQ